MGYGVEFLDPAPQAARLAWRLTKTDGENYVVALVGEDYACTCPDFVCRKEQVGKLCKHLDAALARGLFGKKGLLRSRA